MYVADPGFRKANYGSEDETDEINDGRIVKIPDDLLVFGKKIVGRNWSY